jgi:hypothetical protein
MAINHIAVTRFRLTLETGGVIRSDADAAPVSR